MLADSSFLKNIFYFSKYEKDMINDETIEFMRVFRVVTRCWGPFGPRRGRRGASRVDGVVTRVVLRAPSTQATVPRHRGVQHARREERLQGRGGPLCLDQGHV